MSQCIPCRPVLGQCGPRERGPFPAPPYNPTDYWATRKWVSAFLGKISADVAELSRRVDEVDAKTRPLKGRSFPLAHNEDLYYALSVIIPLLGGEANLGG